MQALKDLIGVVKLFVDHPDDVQVNVIPAAYRLVAELHTNPEDVGQIVGKEGHLISSLRSMVVALAGKHRIQMNLDFITDKDVRAQRSHV